MNPKKILALLCLGGILGNAGHTASCFQVNVSPDGNVAVTSASGGASFTPSGSSEAQTVNQGQSFSSETGQVAEVDANDAFAGSVSSDARSPEGKVVAASSAAPAAGSEIADTSTAAGGESNLGATETAAGGGGGADTQATATLSPASVSLPPVTTSSNPGLTTPI